MGYNDADSFCTGWGTRSFSLKAFLDEMWRFVQGVDEPQPKKAKTSDERLQLQRNYDKDKRQRSFQRSWLKQFPWLVYDEECASMKCKSCVAHSKEGVFVTGCTNMKLQVVKKHADSDSHRRVEVIEKAKVTDKSPASSSLSMLNKAAMDKLKILFANAHYVAKNGRPYTDYVKMCNLDKSNKGLAIGDTYITDKYCQIFVRSIARSIQIKQNENVQRAPFLSVISDGSTDASSKETECVIVRTSDRGSVHTHFIGVKHVPKADSHHISQAIEGVLSARFQDDWKKKLVAMGCDGASVMVGEKTGVVKKMQEISGQPTIFKIHCSAHRLELAFKDAKRAISDTKLPMKVETLLLNLYLFYKCSPLNRSNLQASFKALDKKGKVPTRVGGTRWLPHLKRALATILYGEDAIVQHLEQIQNPCDGAHRKESAAKAKNFLRLLQDPQVRVWMHFLMDVVTCLATVSEGIQIENATLADVYNELQSAKAIIKKYMSSDGRYLSKIASKGVAEVVRSKFLQGILEAIDKRFQGDLHLFRGSSFLAFKNWPVAVDGAELGEYGDDEVSDLATTCTAQITSAGGDPDVIETEWIRFKTELHNSKRTLMRSVTWPDVWDMMEEKYPNLALLVSLLLTLPSSSVDAERGFSRYGLIIPKGATKKPTAKLTNVFGDDDEEEEDVDPNQGKISSKYGTTSGTKFVMKKQTQLDIDKALSEDPTVFDYDGVYDDMLGKKDEGTKKKKVLDRKPKYIGQLLKASEKRALEDERRTERKVQKEREAEGDEFEDKEVFITGAYKKKMQERQEEEERERQADAMEARLDVTKQKDMSGFYRYILNETTNEPKTEVKEESADVKVKKEPASDDEEMKESKTQKRRDESSGSSSSSDSDSESRQASKPTDQRRQKDKDEARKDRRKGIRKRQTSESESPERSDRRSRSKERVKSKRVERSRSKDRVKSKRVDRSKSPSSSRPGLDADLDADSDSDSSEPKPQKKGRSDAKRSHKHMDADSDSDSDHEVSKDSHKKHKSDHSKKSDKKDTESRAESSKAAAKGGSKNSAPAKSDDKENKLTDKEEDDSVPKKKNSAEPKKPKWAKHTTEEDLKDLRSRYFTRQIARERQRQAPPTME